MNERTIHWNLSQPQHTPEGLGLMHMYYDTDLSHILDDSSGYPHNGGEHTLHVRSTIPDLIDWLDLVSDEMGPLAGAFVDDCLGFFGVFLQEFRQVRINQ